MAKYSKTLFVAVILVLVAVGIYSNNLFLQDRSETTLNETTQLESNKHIKNTEDDPVDEVLPPEDLATVKVRVIESEYAANFSDDRVLMGASHHVFVGKVIRQVGNKARTTMPETQFEVQVVYNIKGSLNGSVVVDQQGGYKNGILYIFGDSDVAYTGESGQSYMLQPGSTYLFATRYNSAENWHTLNTFPMARKLITSNSELSANQLRELAENDPRVEQLANAYPNEVLLESDIRANNTLNSYKSVFPTPPSPSEQNQTSTQTSTQETGS